ncbi:UDP-4-amino-4,6-dideoxy-N-acetyl-beta-L-altrosamine N-acetyltransferase [bacterium]|nr:UDP-4-amino-4,6-dideoxy-N-acetyl-beta-L-altrosamine N-acetyltransferase [bacterium]MBU1990605.1 UDP-4-amino-4,6-dideoxy-N-acetyl-beta-L-altrosamine N-acetyltransferase [bacterium]
MLETVSLINFIDLTQKEKEMVLSWRNHSEIKKWMHTSHDISLESHLNFIDTLKNSQQKLYLLVKQGSEPIGIIDFTDITDTSAEIGIYKNPYAKKKGHLLLHTLITYAFETLDLDKIHAEVYKTNTRALNLYEKYNFKKTKTKKIDNKEVLCLELKNENRYF